MTKPAGARRGPAVKQVRGPFVRLTPHPDSCRDELELFRLVERLRQDQPDRRLVADLFSGAGGLSLGLEQAGLQVVLSVDVDEESLETHRHHFAGFTVGWDLAEPTNVERVARLMQSAEIEVLAGGPPCQPFSKAGRSKIRDRVRAGLRDPYDQRRDLWRSFLEVARLARPEAVVMENVPDMVLDREMFILRSIVYELETIGYTVQERVVNTREYGVPQYRQRLILVALRGSRRFVWPIRDENVVNVRSAIGDLPEVEGGWRPEGGAEGWTVYQPDPRKISQFQRRMRRDVPPEHQGRVYDHITRPVREDDVAAFKMMDPATKYSDLPEEFKRYRDDIFDDKYKRLDYDDWSRTITAHIAKDGYWYIHPHQNRTITIREAARLQTFPDTFRFAGPPSAAFRQIGNAVPPEVGRVVGENLIIALDGGPGRFVSSEGTSKALASWLRQQDELRLPWLRASSRWQALAGELVLDRASAQRIRSIWPLLSKFLTPQDFLEAAPDLRMIGGWISRVDRVEEALTLAQALLDRGQAALTDEMLASLVQDKALLPAQADMAALATDSGQDSEEPVIINKGALRVAARFSGESVEAQNRLTEGRVAVARLIGYGPDAREAHLALMELSNTICPPGEPDCGPCPLRSWCRHATRLEATSAPASHVEG